MGRAAARYADEIIVTSDNPRSENPLDIIQDIVSGFPSYARYMIEPDRLLAIKEAVLRAKHDDIVLISGKGHEDYQEINGVRYPFSDAVELGKLLDELK
jgi:UDP-N-acetylmuramyl tripeptide synthase